VEPDSEGGGSRGGVVEAAGIRRRNVLRLALCSEVEVELQQWNLTVRAVAPAAAAWRRLESGEEMSSGSHFAMKSRWNH
jgi:hypothetical protein